MSESIGQTKVGIGTVIAVLLLLGLGFLAIVTKIDRAGIDPVADAMSAMRRQVASDIDLKVDPTAARMFDPPGKFYYVCGEAVLNRPGDGPLALDNVTQRYIVTMNDEIRSGMTLFDGSSDESGRADFQQKWAADCVNG